MEKLCPKCNQSLPRSDFKRLATLSQTRSWLRNPNAQRRMWYWGEVCNTCSKQVRRKRNPSDLPPSEYERRLINEGRPQFFVDLAVAERRARGTEKRQESACRSRKKRYADAFEDHRVNITAVINAVRARQRNAEKYEHDADDIAFLQTYLAHLRKIKAELRSLHQQGRGAPSHWRDLLRPDEIAHLTKLFDRMTQRGSASVRVSFSAAQPTIKEKQP